MRIFYKILKNIGNLNLTKISNNKKNNYMKSYSFYLIKNINQNLLKRIIFIQHKLLDILKIN